jgi:small subunit ribosomal protein S6
VKFAKEFEGMVKKKVEQKATDTKSQEYELVYILNPEITEEVLDTKIGNVTQFITGKEGVVDSVDKWGKKKLAYPLKHFLEGNYILTKFKMSPARCKELEANLRISEDVIRHLLIKVGS